MNQTPTILVRASSLSDKLDCPRRFAARAHAEVVADMGYTLNTLTNNIGAAVGTATHTGSTWSLDEKRKTGIIGNQTEAEHRSLESLKEERDMGVTYDQTTPDQTTAEKQVIRQLTAFRVHIAPHIEPVAVEQRLEGLALPGLTLTGQCDISEEIPNYAGCEGIRDIKTGVKEKYHGAQLGAYSLLRRAHGSVVMGMAVDFIERTSLCYEQPKPRKITYNVAATEKLTWAALRSVKADYETFLATQDIDTFLPNPASILCSPKYCPAFGTKFCTHHATKEISNDNPYIGF